MTKVRSIQCPNCGSGVDLRGGHRILMITCTSCGANLDAHKDFKVISHFKNVQNTKRPKLPFQPGDRCHFKGVNFIVIGMIGWSERDEDGVYRSFEFQLFSPTHGYAWLCRDSDLNYTFMREVRDLPDDILTMRSKVGSCFKARGMDFKIYEKGTETIFYVEGELTYIAKQFDESNYISAYSTKYIYEVSISKGEVEYLFGEYMSPETVYQAFDKTEKPISSLNRHKAAPQTPTSNMKIITRFFAILSLCLALVITVKFNGNRVFQRSISKSDYVKGVEDLSFYISKPGSLMKMKMNCPLDNAWAYFDILVKKDDVEYFNVGKEIAYYHGYEGGERWTEGSRSSSFYFECPDKGLYNLVVSGEGGSHGRNRAQNKTLYIEINENVMISRYYWLFGVILFIVGFKEWIVSAIQKVAENCDD